MFVVAVACRSSDSWDVGAGVVLSDAVVLGSSAGTTVDGVSVRVELADLVSWLISFLCSADSDSAFRWLDVGAAPKLLGEVVVLLAELVGGGSMFVTVARVLGVAGS